eukprot:CAMPEP_0171342324 /NCGR_PEP_ID=MMETSP0878-20121228/14077_1 /TAXON_ID=67004 /ORGANISM="Thalassiosira weissflogii, Strain CCMP1336" /LENGTH=153 /DNA_ID=CAMNT_0011844957 /DNA_START=32 /DNA_END=493 /DNA_ORIENTATION=-
MSASNQHHDNNTENQTSQLRESPSVDPFYFYSIPGALMHASMAIHNTAMEINVETCTITRKSRVSSEVHPDVVLTQASPTDLAEVEAEVSEMLAALGIPESNEVPADPADAAGGARKDNEFDVYSWDWDFSRNDSFSLDDGVVLLNSQTARGA